MIPILYGSVRAALLSANDTAYVNESNQLITVLQSYVDTDTLGIGPLSDAIDCIVVEECNGMYELEMTYPITGKHYSDIAIAGYIKAVPFVNGDPQLFEIYRMTKPINGRVKIYARHVSYRLSYNTVEPFTLTNCTATQVFTALKDNAVEDCPFTFWTDFSGTASKFKIGEPKSFRSCLGGSDGSVLDHWNGEYEWDNFEVKFHNNRGANNGVSLRYGKNLTDLTQDENIENTITGIVPFWKGYDENNEELLVLCDPVYSENADKFPFKRTVPHDFSSDFTDPPSVQLLQQTSEAYVVNNKLGEPEVNLEVSFIPLGDTTEYANLKLLETVNLCDTVNVEFPDLGVSATAKVIKTEYNVLRDRYKSVSLGDAKSNLATTIQNAIIDPSLESVEQNQNALEQAIVRATNSIRGTNGGYVKILDENNDGINDAIVFLDQASGGDLEAATNVWRWNMGGLGFSSSGYAGPYTTAITSAGEIVANLITAGTLQGIRIIGETGSIAGLTMTSSTLSSSDENVSIQFGPNRETLTITPQSSPSLVSAINNILLNSSAPSFDTYDTYDLNGDGSIDSLDLALAQRPQTTGTNEVCYSDYSCKIAPSSDNRMIVLRRAVTTSAASNGTPETVIGAGSLDTDALFANQLVLGDPSTANWSQYASRTFLVHGSQGTAYLTCGLSPVLSLDANSGNKVTLSSYIGIQYLDATAGIEFGVDSGGLGFYNTSTSPHTKLTQLYANPSDNAKLLGNTTSSSYTSVSVTNMQMYRAFVLNACRGSGSGVMATTYIPYEQARLCTSTSVESWAYSAQNGNYYAKCYFDFTNNKIYMCSSGNSDCKAKIYGIT